MEWGVWGYTGIWAKHPLTYSVGVSPNSSSSSVISGTLKDNDKLFKIARMMNVFWSLFDRVVMGSHCDFGGVSGQYLPSSVIR